MKLGGEDVKDGNWLVRMFSLAVTVGIFLFWFVSYSRRL